MKLRTKALWTALLVLPAASGPAISKPAAKPASPRQTPSGTDQGAAQRIEKAADLAASGQVGGALKALDQLIRELEPARDLPLRFRLLDALRTKGNVLQAAGQPQRALASDEAFARHYSPELQDYFPRSVGGTHWEPSVAKDLLQEANRLAESSRSRLAQLIYGELRARQDARFLETYAQASDQLASLLVREGHPEQALALIDPSLERLRGATEGPAVACTESLLYRKAELLPGQASIAVCDLLLARWKQVNPGTEPSAWIHRARLLKGRRMLDLKQEKEGMELVTEALRALGRELGLPSEGPIAALIEHVAWTQPEEGEDLRALRDGIIQAFGRSADPGIRCQVLQVHKAKADRLHLMARTREAAACDEALTSALGQDATAFMTLCIARTQRKDPPVGPQDAAQSQVQDLAQLKAEGRPALAAALLEGLIGWARRQGSEARPILVNALHQKAQNQAAADQLQEALATLEEAIQIAQGTPGEKPSIDPSESAQLLFTKAEYLALLPRPEQAARLCDELVALAPATGELAARVRFLALQLKARIRLDQQQEGEGLRLVEEALAGPVDAVSPLERCSAQVLQASTLCRMDRPAQALALLERLLRKAGRACEEGGQSPLPCIAPALLQKARCLVDLKREPEAEAAFREVEGLQGQEGLEDTGPVIEARLERGQLLVRMRRPQEALAVFDRLLEEALETPGFLTAETVAIVKFHKAQALSGRGEIEAASRLIEDGAKGLDPDFVSTRATAWMNLAFHQLMRAKQIWVRQGKTPEVIRDLEGSLAASRKAEEGCEAPAILQGNLGYALFLLGRQAEAEAALRKAFELGGKALHDAEQQDARRHPVPEDQAFLGLLDRLWKERARP